MGKISTYGLVPSPALLTDFVIGTDISANNETKNFELGQILSLYPQITQKVSLTSSVNQTAVINTPTTVTFNAFQFYTTGLVPLPTGGPTYTGIQIGNAGFYLVELSLTLIGVSASADISAWIKVNGINYGPTIIQTVVGGFYVTLTTSWMRSFSAADIVSIDWQTSNVSGSLVAVSASGSRPAIPSAKITISQV